MVIKLAIIAATSTVITIAVILQFNYCSSWNKS